MKFALTLLMIACLSGCVLHGGQGEFTLGLGGIEVTHYDEDGKVTSQVKGAEVSEAGGGVIGAALRTIASLWPFGRGEQPPIEVKIDPALLEGLDAARESPE